jgi:hypothetical protein
LFEAILNFLAILASFEKIDFQVQRVQGTTLTKHLSSIDLRQKFFLRCLPGRVSVEFLRTNFKLHHHGFQLPFWI